MKLMRKGRVTRFVTDKEARYLKSNGWTEETKEGKTVKKETAPAKESPAKNVPGGVEGK